MQANVGDVTNLYISHIPAGPSKNIWLLHKTYAKIKSNPLTELIYSEKKRKKFNYVENFTNWDLLRCHPINIFLTLSYYERATVTDYVAIYLCMYVSL